MPYHLESRSGQTCVVNSQTSQTVPGGCHPSRVKAMAHMRALYANVPDARTASARVTAEPVIIEEIAQAVSPIENRTASAAPIAPPGEWFNQPEPDGPEPLTVEADGRVHGHLALWNACHVGLINGANAQCVRPPRSSNEYRSFHLGQLVTEDGTPISVGKIVYDGSHASLTADLSGAQQHYDKTGRVGAFVRARDGKHGIYLSGVARSDLTEEGLRDLRANPPSGDWRGLNGKLEMIAALAVPIPGYQTPQLAMTAAGSVETLILPGYCLECEEEVNEMEAEERTPAYIRQREMIARSLNEPEAVTAAVLKAKRRNALPNSAFAIPGERKFPIHDESHARNALARASGTPYEARVRAAVCKRYPNMGECASK